MKALSGWMITVVALSSHLALAFNPRAFVPREQKVSKYWYWDGQKTILESLDLKKIEKTAKNVILFLGDGMGITSVTAMRIYKGQKLNKTGEDELLTFDQFPHVALSKTYGIDRQLSDSANTATAYLCGVKANYGTLGVDGRVVMGDCRASLDTNTHVDSILKWAQDEGKWTGLVTSTRVTHATPAGLYAHTANRNWEASAPDPRCKDIASQLVEEEPGRNINVILGGGIQEFIPNTTLDFDDVNGSRKDSKDLLKSWLEDKKSRNLRAQSVFTVEDFRKINPDETDYLLGLFHSSHLPYVADRPDLKKEYPTLIELTEMAIKILSKNPKGFFLLVEGGKIDVAHHQNWALKSLEEGVEFDYAIEAAGKLTNEEDTLTVVTADHSHTFTIGGYYQKRGTNILGLGGISDVDNKTFTILGYSNGPSYNSESRDNNRTQSEVLEKDYQQDVAVPLRSETHGAEDVGIYARGPMAHLFHGVKEQSYIAHAMGYASCVGPSKELLCKAYNAAAYLTIQSELRMILLTLITFVFSKKVLF